MKLNRRESTVLKVNIMDYDSCRSRGEYTMEIRENIINYKNHIFEQNFIRNTEETQIELKFSIE